MGKTVFYLKNSKQIFFLSIPSAFAFKQAKEHILLQVKPLKLFVKQIFVLISIQYADSHKLVGTTADS